MKTETLQKPWLEKLPSLKTAADFDEAISGLRSDLTAAEGRREALKTEDDAALFSGKDRAAIRAKLSDVTREIDDIASAINGATIHRDVAIIAERKQRRQALRDESAELGKRYAELLKLRIANATALMNGMADEDRIERRIQLNNEEIETSGVTNTEKFTEKENISSIRSANLKPTFIRESDVPTDLSVTGKRWQRWFLRLMSLAKLNPPD